LRAFHCLGVNILRYLTRLFPFSGLGAIIRVRWNRVINNILILGVGGVGVDGVSGFDCSGVVYRRNSWNGSELVSVDR
jgi:hypothetical protein